MEIIKNHVHFVQGKHVTIISEALYYTVQEVLDGRKRAPYCLKIAADETMPLRGFLTCPVCGRTLTGSVSKGLTKRYSYYHCTGGCKCRFRTELVNEAFEIELKKYEPRPEVMEVYKTLLLEAWIEQGDSVQTDRKTLTNQLRELEEKLSYTRELLITKAIDAVDFREMKADYTAQIEQLVAKITALGDDEPSIEHLLKKGISNLFSLADVYKKSGIAGKREITSSIYPEKLSFDGTAVRTIRMNNLVHAIYLTNKSLDKIKRPDKSRKTSLSGQVALSIQFSNYFLLDLKRLSNLTI